MKLYTFLPNAIFLRALLCSGLIQIEPFLACQVLVTRPHSVFIVFTICVFQVHLIEKQEMKRQVLKKRAEQTKEPWPSHVFFSSS